ncbi:MAG TPA: hypothetical protein VF163_21115, partial [Micromonosporaceae bacterium]
FATKSTFRDTVFLSASMRSSQQRLTTLAVNVDRGRFQVNRFDDAGSQLGGLEFATFVMASLDLIHPDVQLALTWPADTSACAVLEAELARFASTLNRTVWVPRPQGAAFVVPGCGEFAAVDEVGSPSTWLVIVPNERSGDDGAARSVRFRTDPDGRLVPVGDPVVSGFPGSGSSRCRRCNWLIWAPGTSPSLPLTACSGSTWQCSPTAGSASSLTVAPRWRSVHASCVDCCGKSAGPGKTCCC